MHLIDPLNDPRWMEFVDTHPSACAFHTDRWLRALEKTYGYKPLAVTSSLPGTPLTDALAFCQINSWITGRRIVSLPFSDHCQPLLTSSADWEKLTTFLEEYSRREGFKSVEIRPAHAGTYTGEPDSSYYIHWLDLTPPIEEIFTRLQKDSIQRKIRRAEREGLTYESGRSPELIAKFYRLLLYTRRRHQLPPQPKEWFQNIADCMQDRVQIRIASKDATPIAAILTLTHRNSMIYKYGCSDERHHAMGGVPFLYWKMIQDAKQASIPLLDFGRSDLDNPGLIRFKDQWGTTKTELRYYRLPPARPGRKTSGAAARTAKAVFAHLPDAMLEFAGKILYRHIG
jgi:hypothetical protein